MIRFGSVFLTALLLALLFAFSTVDAATPLQQPTPQPSVAGGLTTQQCLECHTKPDQFKKLNSGEELYLTIDGNTFNTSRHAAQGCTGCHSEIKSFPHPVKENKTLRQVTFDYSKACATCHAEQSAKQLDSVHNQLHLKGNENTATCADCHNPHNTQKPNDPRSRIPQTCAKCHSTIAADFQNTVHGVALNQNNPDVPSCISCHGVHNIADPRTAQFLNRSPEICASCHADATRMAKYGLNTNVYNTYVTDFHGSTVTMFEKETPDQLPNKPLCIDCHGVHNILSTKDPQKGLQVKQNLLTTCQKCHPNATTSFSSAWLSHYDPTPTKNPLVYYVNLFYQFFIPAVLGGMALFVLADAGQRIYKRFRGTQKGASL
jgi:predicted CXXCH cytochrome family protein